MKLLHNIRAMFADLLRVLQIYQEAVVFQERFFIVLFAELNRTPELSDSFSQALSLLQSIGQLLTRYQAEGVLKPENHLHCVAVLLGPMMYFSMIARSVGDTFMPPMEIEELIRNFQGGRYRSNQAPKLG